MNFRVLVHEAIERELSLRDQDSRSVNKLSLVTWQGIGDLKAIVQAQGVDAAIFDAQAGQVDINDICAWLRRMLPEISIIVVDKGAMHQSASGWIDTGADNVITGTLNLEHVAALLEKTRGNRPNLPVNAAHNRHGVVTRDPKVLGLLDDICAIADSNCHVLLHGPTGAGKELFAHVVHLNSKRASEPFVALNCAAVPAEMMEAELFGYTKGAFTGASGSNEGLFRAAHGGTLFLDEIGDLPLPLQRKLLRVIDTGEVRPVGSNDIEQVDVKVVSATHRDVGKMVAEGKFRDDLFFRIAGAEFEVPSLAEHKIDIPVLASNFLFELYKSGQTEAKFFSKKSLSYLERRKWPGNVRQLKNTVEYCAALATSLVIPEALTRFVCEEQGKKTRLADILQSFEYQHLSFLIKSTGGNVEELSSVIGKSRSSTYRMLSAVGLSPSGYRR